MISEFNKVRARSHLGYLQVQSSSTFVLGIPAGVQTQFQIEGAWDRILPQAEALFIDRLDKLDALEVQLVDNQENAEVDKIGDITINKDAFEQLLKRYRYWQTSLANLMGIEPNPFDQRFGGSASAGGINMPVNNG